MTDPVPTTHRKEIYRRLRRLLLAAGYNAPGTTLERIMYETLDALAEYVEEQREEAVAEAERNRNG